MKGKQDDRLIIEKVYLRPVEQPGDVQNELIQKVKVRARHSQFIKAALT